MGKQSLVGVHFRSWSAAVGDGNYLITLKKPSIEVFTSQINAILEKNPNSSFYLATDDRKTINEFRNKTQEDRILTFPMKEAGRSSLDDMKNALVDWFLLQRTDYIIGTVRSTYSDEAAIWTSERFKIELGPINFDLVGKWEKPLHLIQQLNLPHKNISWFFDNGNVS